MKADSNDLRRNVVAASECGRETRPEMERLIAAASGEVLDTEVPGVHDNFFDFSGANARVIVGETPAQEPSGTSRAWQLLLLSATTATALDAATGNLAAHLKEKTEQNLADVAYTLQVGRQSFEHRRMLVCRDRQDAAVALETRDPQRIRNRVLKPGRRSVAFMFPGLGDHYVNMALGLYQSEPKFREEVDRCCELLEPLCGVDLRAVLYPVGAEDRPEASKGIDLRKMLLARRGQTDEASRRLNQTHLTQPIIFVVEYALARLWMEWGVQPESLLGYSIGEYVAACLAGVFTLEDALLLVARRAQLIQGLAGGLMLALHLPEHEAEPLLNDDLSLAGINGPSLCVVSGRAEAIKNLQDKLTKNGTACQQLQTSHAFHSKMMEPIAKSFGDLVSSLKLQPPRIPFISNVTGNWITAAEATDPAYWVQHLCGAVRFSDGIRELWRKPGRVLLEVGPGQMLSSLAIQHAEFGSDVEPVALSSVRYVYDRRDDLAFLLNAAGQLWLAGVEVDWSKFYAGERRYRVPLPT